MKAVQFDAYGAADVLQWRETAQPSPGPGEILIDVHAVSANPIDWKVRSGRMASVYPLTFPAGTGRDGAGIVRAAGPDADASLIGKRVSFFAPRGQGSWAEQVALPAANAAVIPDAVSLTDAAAIPLAGTSAWIPLVEVAKVSDGMEVLIHAGAGGVGSLAIQIARARGAQVTATCSQRNAELVSSFGAHRVIAYDRVPFEKQVGDIDVVFDTMGGDIHRRSYEVLKRGGTMVCLSAEPYENRGAEFGVTVVQAQILPRRDILESLLSMAAARELRVFVEQVLPITEFRQAQELSQSGHVRGKIVMQLRGPNGTPIG